MASLSNAFQAAHAVLEERDHPRNGKPLSVRAAAIQYSTSAGSVQRAINALARPVPVVRGHPGRPRVLTADEDRSLVKYALWIQQGGTPATKKQLEAAANELRRRRDPASEKVSKSWYGRWIAEHPEFPKSVSKPGPRGRKARPDPGVAGIDAFLRLMAGTEQATNATTTNIATNANPTADADPAPAIPIRPVPASTTAIMPTDLDLAHLLPPSWRTQATAWLVEDTPSLDYAGHVVGDAPRTATLWAKSLGVLAGRPFFDEVMAQCGCSVGWLLKDGDHITLDSGGKIKIAVVSGPARGILLAERVALNALSRCSGIATRSSRLVSRLRAAGYHGIVAGTRKTTPGFRLVEKYGMLVGGADTHRMDLSAMVMLKDNHVWSRGGSIHEAVKAAKAVAGFAMKIDVEVQSEAEADAAVAAGADIVMLDNFAPAEVRTAAAGLKKRWAGKKQFLIEVSGGLSEDNVDPFICKDIDILSTSFIHQGVPHLDFSLKIDH